MELEIFTNELIYASEGNGIIVEITVMYQTDPRHAKRNHLELFGYEAGTEQYEQYKNAIMTHQGFSRPILEKYLSKKLIDDFEIGMYSSYGHLKLSYYFPHC